MIVFSRKALMVGAVVCALSGSAFAYTSSTTTTTTVTSGSVYDPASPNANTYPHEDMGGVVVPDTGQSQPTYGVPRQQKVASSSSSTNSSGAITNPQQISACLCMESSYQSLNSQVSAKQAAYSQAVAQRAALDNELASEKANASAPGQVDAIRVTSEKRIALQGQINDVYIPQLQAATAQYNASVGEYQQSCAGKAFDAAVEAQVQSTLQCHG